MRGFGPAYWNGGTFVWGDKILTYNDLPANLKIESGRLWYKSLYREDFSELCSLENVAAAFDESGAQIYP